MMSECSFQQSSDEDCILELHNKGFSDMGLLGSTYHSACSGGPEVLGLGENPATACKLNSKNHTTVRLCQARSLTEMYYGIVQRCDVLGIRGGFSAAARSDAVGF